MYFQVSTVIKITTVSRVRFRRRVKMEGAHHAARRLAALLYFILGETAAASSATRRAAAAVVRLKSADRDESCSPAV